MSGTSTNSTKIDIALSPSGTGSVYLGRPWRNYARVVFQNSNLGSNMFVWLQEQYQHANPAVHRVAAGWKNWNDSTPNTDHAYFGEYNNTGYAVARNKAPR